MTGIGSLANEDRFRALLRFVLGLFLVAPFLIWIVFIPEWNWPDFGDVIQALINSLSQALLSAVCTMVAGFFLFRSLQSWTRLRSLKLIEAVLLVPNLVPPLFLALSLLSWTPVAGDFPYGLGAVVVAHVLLNSGLVAVSLDRLVKTKLGGLADAAWVMGVPPARFWRRILWPLLSADIAYLFLFVFSVCFTSFSLPLLLGGDRVATLEVAIYDAIRMDGEWDRAVILAAIQSCFLFFMASVLPRPFFPQTSMRWALPYLGSRVTGFFVFVPAFVLLAGWISGLGSALNAPLEDGLLAPVLAGAVTSLALGLTVGMAHLVGFLSIAFVLPHERMERFLNGYLAPSSAITGFGLLLLPVESEIGRLALTAVALTMISLPLLYRWIVHSALKSLSRQVQVARTLGASWSSILFEIVWPQSASKILRASGLAALWASGDFAVSGILLGTDGTLPLVMQNLLNSYRFESANLLLLPLLACGLILYGLFTGAAKYVAR